MKNTECPEISDFNAENSKNKKEKLVLLSSRAITSDELSVLSQNGIYKVYEFKNESNCSIEWDVLRNRYDCIIFNVQFRKSRRYVGANWVDISGTSTVAFIVNWFESTCSPYEPWVSEFVCGTEEELHVLRNIKIDQQPKNYGDLISQLITPVMSKPLQLWMWAVTRFGKCFFRL